MERIKAFCKQIVIFGPFLSVKHFEKSNVSRPYLFLLRFLWMITLLFILLSRSSYSERLCVPFGNTILFENAFLLDTRSFLKTFHLETRSNWKLFFLDWKYVPLSFLLRIYSLTLCISYSSYFLWDPLTTEKLSLLSKLRKMNGKIQEISACVQFPSYLIQIVVSRSFEINCPYLWKIEIIDCFYT